MSSPALTERIAVLELRRYTLHPGRRDALIELFEREFIEPQEALGAHVLATFRDLDHPDRFVWLRGFADMPARGDALAAFYGGPAWQAHRAAANATMLDSDDVHLLRPLACDRALQAALRWVGVGGDLLACWVTEPTPNNFPRLPVHEDQPVVAWLTRFDDEAAQLRHAALLHASRCLERAEWRTRLAGEAVQWRLAPTPRSALRRAPSTHPRDHDRNP